MDKWPEKNNDQGYTVRIEGEDPQRYTLTIMRITKTCMAIVHMARNDGI